MDQESIHACKNGDYLVNLETGQFRFTKRGCSRLGYLFDYYDIDWRRIKSWPQFQHAVKQLPTEYQEHIGDDLSVGHPGTAIARYQLAILLHEPFELWDKLLKESIGESSDIKA